MMEATDTKEIIIECGRCQKLIKFSNLIFKNYKLTCTFCGSNQIKIGTCNYTLEVDHAQYEEKLSLLRLIHLMGL